MKKAAIFLTALVAVEHLGILVLEMFFWNHPVGQRIFGMTPEVAASVGGAGDESRALQRFSRRGSDLGTSCRPPRPEDVFSGCVVVAGIFGGLTAKTSILFTQGLPALIALAMVFLSKEDRTSGVSDS